MKFTTKSSNILLAAVSASLSSVDIVFGQRNYAVYYDPADEPDRNPMGDGFTPKGQKDWGQVNYYEGFEYFRTVDYGTNICTQDTLFSRFDLALEHQQSPIEVEDGPYWGCNDRHTTHKFGGTDCDYAFASTPYGLSAKFRCDKAPYMDMSRTTTWWELDNIEVKVPAEHVVGDGDQQLGGRLRRYDGEMKLIHSGTQNENADHRGRISIISVFLDARGTRDSDEYEKYLKRWERAQRNDYNRCNLRYNSDTCRTRRSNNNNRDLLQEDEEDDGFDVEGFIASLTEDEDDEDFLYDVSKHETTNSDNEETMNSNNSMEDYDEDDDEEEENDDESTTNTSTGLWNMLTERWLQNNNNRRDRKRDRRNRRNRNKNNNNDDTRLRPYQLPKQTGTEFYYGYDGSLTVPPCSERVWYRIMRQPLVISNSQLRRTKDLIAQHLNDKCELGTVGRRLNDGTCHVDVARDLQFTHIVHHVTDCVEWHVDDSRR